MQVIPNPNPNRTVEGEAVDVVRVRVLFALDGRVAAPAVHKTRQESAMVKNGAGLRPQRERTWSPTAAAACRRPRIRTGAAAACSSPRPPPLRSGPAARSGETPRPPHAPRPTDTPGCHRTLHAGRSGQVGVRMLSVLLTAEQVAGLQRAPSQTIALTLMTCVHGGCMYGVDHSTVC